MQAHAFRQGESHPLYLAGRTDYTTCMVLLAHYASIMEGVGHFNQEPPSIRALEQSI